MQPNDSLTPKPSEPNEVNEPSSAAPDIAETPAIETTPATTPPAEAVPEAFVSPEVAAPEVLPLPTTPEVAPITFASPPEPAAAEPAAEVSPSVPGAPTPPAAATPEVSPATPWVEPSSDTLLSAQTTDVPASVMVGGTDSGPIATVVPAKKRLGGGGKTKRFVLAGAIILLLVILGGGYVFAFYLPNRPSNVYTSSLSRTSQAYDKLVAYSNTVQTAKYKSTKLDGSFKFTSSSISGDGTFTGQSDNKNSTGTLSVDIAGEKVAINGRTITADQQTTPDIYVQISGVKSLLDSYGLNSFDTLDGQWIAIDHTLLESVAASAAQDKRQATPSVPTSAQLQDALKAIGTVNNQYLFKADASHAVIKNEKYLGKSTQDGRQVLGYQVGYDKANLKAYIRALQSGLNETSLNDWAQKATGKSISEVKIQSLLDSIDKADSNYTFTMYVNAKTKLVDTLHFKDTKSSDYFEISQGYTGGSVYPFSLKVVSTSDAANAGTVLLTAKIDSATNKISFGASANLKANGSPITFTATANAAMSNDDVKVIAPTGAKSVLEIYNALGLGGLAADTGISGGTSLNDTGLFTLTQ